MSSRHPHLDVADRFRTLLEGTGLTREGFVAALDGAVSARSLYAVLCGARRPSRSLALLIERTWGFRASYLLDGESPAWTRAESIGPGVVAVELSQAESAVIKFMRTSVENSRTLLAELDHAACGRACSSGRWPWCASWTPAARPPTRPIAGSIRSSRK
jgi:hypothetical protein